MGNQHHGSCLFRGQNIVHRLNGPVVELSPRFRASRSHVIGVVAPRGIHIRMTLSDLLRRQPLPDAKVDFAQAHVLNDLQSGCPANQHGRFTGSLEVATVQSRGAGAGQTQTRQPGLRPARGVEGWVKMSLYASRLVPVGKSVPHHVQETLTGHAHIRLSLGP